MVSELLFYFLHQKVMEGFERNPLTHTVTHITIVYSGQSSTNGCFLATKFPEIEKPSGISLKNLPPSNCANSITSPWILSDDSTQGVICFLCFVSYCLVI